MLFVKILFFFKSQVPSYFVWNVFSSSSEYEISSRASPLMVSVLSRQLHFCWVVSHSSFTNRQLISAIYYHTVVLLQADFISAIYYHTVVLSQTDNFISAIYYHTVTLSQADNFISAEYYHTVSHCTCTETLNILRTIQETMNTVVASH